jgi:hypothetical protein
VTGKKGDVTGKEKKNSARKFGHLNPPEHSAIIHAVEVKQRHNIHIGHHQTKILYIYRYTISYIDIVQYIGAILFDIVYNIRYDIVYDV